ncbi:uncharacterized protein TTMY_1405 [Thermus thermophilus]|nr:uncharacterized protein TTMY_1405 [Thermus thermophilus]
MSCPPSSSGAFDRTYEGLKLALPVGFAKSHPSSFDRTYEGLKQPREGPGGHPQGPFDRTYEGLKHGEWSFGERGF